MRLGIKKLVGAPPTTDNRRMFKEEQGGRVTSEANHRVKTTSTVKVGGIVMTNATQGGKAMSKLKQGGREMIKAEQGGKTTQISVRSI